MYVSNGALGGGGAMIGALMQVALVRLVRWKLLPPSQLISRLLGSSFLSQCNSKPCVTLTPAVVKTLPPPVIRPSSTGCGTARAVISNAPASQQGAVLQVPAGGRPAPRNRVALANGFGVQPVAGHGPWTLSA